MGMIYAGSSGWAFPKWRPGFYPPKLSSTKFLSYYATRLNSVEVNYTFRILPTDKSLNGWIEATPADFKFTIKAHKSITHIRRLRDAREDTSKFLASLRPLVEAEKLGPVLFQLPPFLKFDLELLRGFLPALPRTVRTAFEFRHDSWFNDDVYAELRRANAALCLAESDKLTTPDVNTATFSYLRLRKSKYAPKAREEISTRVKELVRRGDVFVYFKHEDDPAGALHAEELLT